jgi:hypothetical protein
MLVEPVERSLFGEFAGHRLAAAAHPAAERVARRPRRPSAVSVAFHLSNAYAKTGTTSRYELVQLVRTG